MLRVCWACIDRQSLCHLWGSNVALVTSVMCVILQFACRSVLSVLSSGCSRRHSLCVYIELFFCIVYVVQAAIRSLCVIAPTQLPDTAWVGSSGVSTSIGFAFALAFASFALALVALLASFPLVYHCPPCVYQPCN